MKRKWKIVITLLVVVVAAAGVYASTVYSKRGVVSVQTGQVLRQKPTQESFDRVAKQAKELGVELDPATAKAAPVRR